jgi:hypothetical protein
MLFYEVAVLLVGPKRSRWIDHDLGPAHDLVLGHPRTENDLPRHEFVVLLDPLPCAGRQVTVKRRAEPEPREVPNLGFDH